MEYKEKIMEFFESYIFPKKYFGICKCCGHMFGYVHLLCFIAPQCFGGKLVGQKCTLWSSCHGEKPHQQCPIRNDTAIQIKQKKIKILLLDKMSQIVRKYGICVHRCNLDIIPFDDIVRVLGKYYGIYKKRESSNVYVYRFSKKAILHYIWLILVSFLIAFDLFTLFIFLRTVI